MVLSLLSPFQRPRLAMLLVHTRNTSPCSSSELLALTFSAQEVYRCRDGALFKDGEWVFHVYDPPTKFTGRHNEVGFIMKASDRAAQMA